jgi:GMP synthase (glutamine-hydrolysing)
VLALQFHPEVTAEGLERWYVGHICELSAAGLSVPALREQARSFASDLERRCSRFFTHWLSLVSD